jgi:hypothetical protein
MTRLTCTCCHKVVSTPVPDDIIVRGVAVCPECIEQGKVVFPEPEAIEEVARLREALVKVVAHTGYIPGAERGLLVGLLASIDRIARAALSGERKGE